MDTEDIIKATQTTKRLIQDDNYYKYIFKKTERIVSVVFYITHNVDKSVREDRQVTDLEAAATTLHNAVLHSLESRAHLAQEEVHETAHALVSLLSKLRIAAISGIVTADVVDLINNEADSVLRAVTQYLGEEAVVFDRFDTAATPRARRESAGTPRETARARGEAPASAAATPLSAQDPSDQRRARIKAIIETQGEVSIKDISGIITDVSEKTIQRELNDMIDANLIKRIGERRWSRYVLF